MMPVSMVTDKGLKGLKEILPIGLGIGSDEGDSLRKDKAEGRSRGNSEKSS